MHGMVGIEAKQTYPMVVMNEVLKESSANRNKRQLLPTPVCRCVVKDTVQARNVLGTRQRNLLLLVIGRLVDNANQRTAVSY